MVALQGADGLATSIARSGNEALACANWDEFLAQSRHHAVDLVLCHDSCAADVPTDVGAPVVQLDGVDALTEEALEPLLAMAVELATQVKRLHELENVVTGIRSGSAMVGNSPAMRRLRSAVSRAADSDATVLIEGPAGSGKSLAARAVHLKSRRCEQPLVVHECGELTAESLASEIASSSQTTLVLESVDKLAANAQAVLVKHLKERSTARSGPTVRLIATTSVQLPDFVARGAFREDLFYRLHAFPIVVPSLGERAEDVHLLADAILESGVPASGRNHLGFTPAARMLLESMQWPGNVAQLEATVRRGQVLAGGGVIDRQHLLAPTPGIGQPTVAPSATANAAADEVELTEDAIRPFEEEEKFLLGRALQATKGNVRRAAQLLGIGRATLYRKIQQYDLRLH
ncbi:MAG: sigma 54-interacting transcriptional regulator [Planctomycetota bacterium]